jgi:hypothetical protein
MMQEPWMELLGDSKFLGIVCGAIVAAIAILAAQARRAYAAKVEADLKRDLASRGRSVEEIERIIRVKSEKNECWEARCVVSQQSQPERG